MWTWLQATKAERALFANHAHTLTLPFELAAPRNRFREARRIETPDGTWFLKVFTKTKTKNRWRNRWTRPRCVHDAERERLIAEQLLAAGFPTARPVAIGFDGAASFYLCAELPGRSLRELLARSECDRGLARRIAEHCGAILRAGIVLPDLSCDHVLIDGPEIAVIDLHNGRLGRPRQRELVRMLRNFVRSAEGSSVPRRQALAFAVRLLRAAGFPGSTRAILTRVPPLDTHSRYDAPGKSEQYANRNPHRHARELALLRAVWPGRPGELVLDAPCGAGRLRELAEGELGARWLGADRSLAMLREGTGPRVLADALKLPFADRSTDGVVVFRFLHHLPEAKARACVLEAARVARRFVVVSYFHPWSWNRVRRAARALVQGKSPSRHALWPGTITRWLEEAGFARASVRRDAAFFRELVVATFERGQ